MKIVNFVPLLLIPVVGALEVDSVSTAVCSGKGSADNACLGSLQWVHPGAEGDVDQGLVVVSVALQFQRKEAKDITATYGTKNMAVIGEYYGNNPPQGIRGIKLFYLYDQFIGTGLQYVKINWAGQAEDDTDAVVAGAVVYVGVQQGADLNARFYSDYKEVTVTRSKQGNLIQDVMLFSRAVEHSATGTLLWLNDTSANAAVQGGAQVKAGADGPVLMAWRPVDSTGVYVAGALDIPATTASRAPTTHAPTPQPTNPTSSPTRQPQTSSPSPPPSALPPSESPSPAPSVAPPTLPTAPSPPPSSSPSTGSLQPTRSPTPPTAAAAATGEKSSFPWHIIWPILICIPVLALGACGYYVLRLKKRVYKAEELFMAPSDFAKLVEPADEMEEPDPDALSFSESRYSRSIQHSIQH